MDTSMLMLMMVMSGQNGGNLFGGGTTSEDGTVTTKPIEMNKLMAQMFVKGVANDLVKVSNFQSSNNIMYLMF